MNLTQNHNAGLTVVHIVESFAGGVFDFIVDLTTSMNEYQHIIIHSTRDHTPHDIDSYFSSDVRLIEWKYGTREVSILKDIQASIELFDLLKKYPGDIYHLHSSKAGFLGRIVTRLLSKSHQTLYTPHGISFLRQDISWAKKTFYIALEKIGAMFGGTVVACSPSEQNAIEKNGIHCTMIANGIKEPSQSYTQKTTNKIIIGTCGRISYQKNPSLFNQIATHYNHIPSISFVWIGNGELEDMLTSPNIRITGWLSKANVEYEMAQFDLYLSTSLWEGLPLTVISAMSLDKPLILSRCTGNIDLVEEGHNGYTYETLEDAIKKINQVLNSGNIDYFRNHSHQMHHKYFYHTTMIEHYKNLYIQM
jgi:glycosyltransferase involved in cell wall biosynthesis